MKESKSFIPFRDGFKGFYYEAAGSKDSCIICITGDEGNDFLSMAFSKYFVKKGLNVLSLALNQENDDDEGVSLWKLDCLKSAVLYLKSSGFSKIAVCGISMQSVIALTAASVFNDISLTIAFSPADFIPWGFKHGAYKDYKKAEWPTGESLIYFEGKPLPFHPAPLARKEYWEKFLQDSDKFKEQHSRGVFDLSEEVSPIKEEEFIKVENIKGRVVLIGSKDDSMWSSEKYILRMAKRLEDKKATCQKDILTYDYGTHLLVPSSLLSGAVPVLGFLIYCIYSSGRKNMKKCSESRKDLERKLDSIISDFIKK